MSSSGSILVWTPICKAEGKDERSSLLPCYFVLPSPAQPRSPGCWSENGFLVHFGLTVSAAPCWHGHCSHAVWCRHLQWGWDSAKKELKVWGKSRGMLWSSIGLLVQDRLQFGRDLSFL